MRGICIVFVLLLSLSLDMVNGKGLMSILFALAIVQKKITAFTAMNFSYPFVLVDVYNCFTRKGLLSFFNYSIPNPAFLLL